MYERGKSPVASQDAPGFCALTLKFFDVAAIQGVHALFFAATR